MQSDHAKPELKDMPTHHNKSAPDTIAILLHTLDCQHMGCRPSQQP